MSNKKPRQILLTAIILCLSLLVAPTQAIGLDTAPIPPIASFELEERLGYDVTLSPATQTLVAEETAYPKPLNERDVDPENQNPHLIALGAQLMSLSDRYAENLAQAAFTDGGQYLELYVKSVDGPGVAEAQKLAADAGLSGNIILVPVEHSLADLERAAHQLQNTTEGGISLSISPIDNALVASVEAELLFQEENLSEGRVVTPDTLPGNINSGDPTLKDMKVIIEESEISTAASRDRDTNPYFMGARIFSQGNGKCSLGVPLVVNGKFMSLTAGHCLGKTFTNGWGAFVGNQYTTAFSTDPSKNRTHVHGDWKLLTGTNYRTHVWTGPAEGAQSSMEVADARFDALAMGTGLCTSGQTTGQICRYVVAKHVPVSSDEAIICARRNANSGCAQYYRSAFLTKMHHQHTPGVNDNAGFKGGDSGGPVYYNAGNGRITVVGIVTATSPGKYFFTRLQAVKSWNNNVRFG